MPMCKQPQHSRETVTIDSGNDVVDLDVYTLTHMDAPSPARSQSRSTSLLETIASTAIGFAVSLVLTAAVLPAFGYQTTWTHDFWITCIFTVASIVRGYFVRRLFESLR